MVQISKNYEKIYSNSLHFALLLLDWLSFFPSLKGNKSHKKGLERVYLTSQGMCMEIRTKKRVSNDLYTMDSVNKYWLATGHQRHRLKHCCSFETAEWCLLRARIVQISNHMHYIVQYIILHIPALIPNLYVFIVRHEQVRTCNGYRLFLDWLLSQMLQNLSFK